MREVFEGVQTSSYMSIWVQKSREVLNDRMNDLTAFEEDESQLELRVMEVRKYAIT